VAEVTWFGTEQDPCPDPDRVGCQHPIGIHDRRASGCSHIGSSGWCDCTFEPEAPRSAELKEVVSEA
jgi:hypothetical protein